MIQSDRMNQQDICSLSHRLMELRNKQILSSKILLNSLPLLVPIRKSRSTSLDHMAGKKNHLSSEQMVDRFQADMLWVRNCGWGSSGLQGIHLHMPEKLKQSS